jgi:hypothetical protein
MENASMRRQYGVDGLRPVTTVVAFLFTSVPRRWMCSRRR